MTFDATTATREALEDHIADDCPDMCGGDPQVMADLDEATDAELAAYITDTHAWHRENALPLGSR